MSENLLSSIVRNKVEYLWLYTLGAVLSEYPYVLPPGVSNSTNHDVRREKIRLTWDKPATQSVLNEGIYEL